MITVIRDEYRLIGLLEVPDDFDVKAHYEAYDVGWIKYNNFNYNFDLSHQRNHAIQIARKKLRFDHNQKILIDESKRMGISKISSLIELFYNHLVFDLGFTRIVIKDIVLYDNSDK